MRLWIDPETGRVIETPAEVSTSVIAVLGKRGSGKTYFAGVLEEELAESGIPFIVLDPMSCHYTIRERYEVLILGCRGSPLLDAEIAPGIGGDVAELLVDAGLSSVIDLSGMRRRYQEEFVRDLCWRLLERSRTPRMIIFEEADAWAPQTRSSECREAVETLVRRGRQFGLGATLLSQRPAIVSKDALSQADIYLFFRLISPRDLDAVRETLDYAGISRDEVKEILASLPKFRSGDAIVYSPEMLKMLRRIRVRRRLTRHAAETPRPELIKPIRVDFGEIASRIAEICRERAEEEEEIARLRKMVREYERRLKRYEEELRIAQAVKKYMRPELLERVERMAELEAKVRNLEERLREERRLREGAEKALERAYRRIDEAGKKLISILDEVKLSLAPAPKPGRPEEVKLRPCSHQKIGGGRGVYAPGLEPYGGDRLDLPAGATFLSKTMEIVLTGLTLPSSLLSSSVPISTCFIS